ncbi:hypothetical protein [Armatimonas rosea]|uniref:Uncharacterized protein n=1 Tax=Armatimonas rosea TaxID=685828 RepID=A0A7W9SL42_ARMRO|nr:hypothetical protein [Armatimonas rosea]MBB6048621.1 hypothetical protein [Armatimonas rosea]
MDDNTMIVENESTESANKRMEPTRKPSGFYNSRQSAELSRSEQIVQTAKLPEHSAKLTARGVGADVVSALEEKITDARELADIVAQGAGKKQRSAQTEGDAKKLMLQQVYSIQAAARVKYADSDPLALRDYGIGGRLTALNRADLEALVNGIATRLAQDTLPGIPTTAAADLRSAIATWKSANASQSATTEERSTARSRRDTMVQEINALRRKVQFAADGAYPHWEPENAAIRTAFGLPKNKPFAG